MYICIMYIYIYTYIANPESVLAANQTTDGSKEYKSMTAGAWQQPFLSSKPGQLSSAPASLRHI